MAAMRKVEADAPTSVQADVAPRDLKLAVEGAASVASPARALQARLAESFDPCAAYPEPEVAKWPGAARVGLLVALAAASWSLVLGGAWAAGLAWSVCSTRL